jgi:hypothetical protein
MAITRSNPVGLKALPSYPEANIRPQVNVLVQSIREVDSGNQEWLGKQLRNTALRFGERKERRLPWKGASNVSVPLVDGIIRRWRPGISSLVLDAEPVAFFMPNETSDFDPAREVEPFFTWMFVEQMQTAPEVARLADIVASRGHGYVSEGWRYRTERQSRILALSEIFPNGWQAAVQAIQAEYVQSGQPAPSPNEILIKFLAGEYGMDPRDPAELAQLTEAVEEIMTNAEYVQLEYETIIEDRPEWVALDPVNCIVPPNQDPEDADFFCTIHRMTVEDVRKGVRDQRFDPAAAAKVMESIEANASERGEGESAEGGSVRQQIWDLLNDKAGTSPEKAMGAKAVANVWKVLCRLDVDGDGFTERVVMWYHPTTDTILAIQPYVFPFKCWPVTCVMIDPSAARPVDARGLPEMLITFQKVINATYNMRQDAGQIILAPTLAMRQLGPNYQKALRWGPGGIIPVQNPETDVKTIIMDLRILGELLREQQITQSIAEAYVGVFDASLTNPARSVERRTATEVSAISNLSSNIFGLDAKLFQLSMSKSFNKVWALYEEFGPEETFYRVQGVPKPKLAKKSEIAKQYDIRAAGNPANTQKNIQINNLLQALQIASQDPTGSVNFAEIVRRVLFLMDPQLARVAIYTPEERAREQTIAQAAALLGQSKGEAPPDAAAAVGF